MILLYSTVVLMVGSLAWLTRRSAARAERNYVALAKAAQAKEQKRALKGGTNQTPEQYALGLYSVGHAISKREEAHDRFNHRTELYERISGVLGWIRKRPGKGAGYLSSKIDTALAFMALDWSGLVDVKSVASALWNVVKASI